jgi:NAD(P)-dependent dehydrogenase (short-subunit alcohol dehydrogenase family)
MKGLLAVVFVLLCAGSYFFIKVGLPMLLHETPVIASQNTQSNANASLNTNNQALIPANQFEVVPLQDIDDKKYHNFFETGIIKDGNLYRWHKTDLTYYIDRLAARRLSDSKIRRAFDWWARKSKLFTFTRVTDPERADIFIQVATASEKDRMGEAGPDKAIVGKTYNFKGNAAYASAKCALNAYVKSVSRHVAKDNVIISAVAPGAVFIEGRHLAKLQKENSPALQDYFKNNQTINRLAETSEVAAVISFMCSEKASFMAGSIVGVDGAGM